MGVDSRQSSPFQHLLWRDPIDLLETAAEMRKLAESMRKGGFGDGSYRSEAQRRTASFQALRPDPAHRRRAENAEQPVERPHRHGADDGEAGRTEVVAVEIRAGVAHDPFERLPKIAG